MVPAELTVTLTNDGQLPIRFARGTAVGIVLDATGNVVSAPASAVVGDVGIAVDLAAGESMDLPLVVSTASCDPELGYRLPPGDYLLAASVQHSNGDVMTLRSPPIPITIGE